MVQESIVQDEPTDEITARQARRLAKRGVDGGPLGSMPAAPATHIDARDHASLRTTLGAWQQAQGDAQRAQDQLRQAAELEIATRGAYGFVSQDIRGRYGLGPDDQVDPETGEIRRVVAAATDAPRP
jgi:hypothetical protein